MTQYAILAGIGRYEDPQITDLEFAASDVKAFQKRLVDILGFKQENIHVFTHDRDGNYANDTAIMKQFSRLNNIMKPEDTFLFYFAGHGIEKKDGVYLLTANSESFSPSLLKKSSIPISFLQEEMAETQAATRIFIIDACRNNPDKGRGDEDNLLTDSFSREIIMATRSKTSAQIHPATGLLFACNKGERAYEWPEKGHGVFSWYLMEGIEQISRERGAVDLGTLEKYVKSKVVSWCGGNLSKEKKQTPWLIVDGSVPELAVLKKSAKKTLTGLMRCPLCGRYNDLSQVFRCPSCRKDHLCIRHQDEDTFLCIVCQKQKNGEKSKSEQIYEAPKQEIHTDKDQFKSGTKEINRDDNFIAYDDGTVLDTKTGLMWAAKDNGRGINWQDAKTYCENFKGGGYTDWRMPAMEELEGLYDKNKGYLTKDFYNLKAYLTELIYLSCNWIWSSETSGASASVFRFFNGVRYSVRLSSYSDDYRALPVRVAKKIV